MSLGFLVSLLVNLISSTKRRMENWQNWVRGVAALITAATYILMTHFSPAKSFSEGNGGKKLNLGKNETRGMMWHCIIHLSKKRRKKESLPFYLDLASLFFVNSHCCMIKSSYGLNKSQARWQERLKRKRPFPVLDKEKRSRHLFNHAATGMRSLWEGNWIEKPSFGVNMATLKHTQFQKWICKSLIWMPGSGPKQNNLQFAKPGLTSLGHFWVRPQRFCRQTQWHFRASILQLWRTQTAPSQWP